MKPNTKIKLKAIIIVAIVGALLNVGLYHSLDAIKISSFVKWLAVGSVALFIIYIIQIIIKQR